MDHSHPIVVMWFNRPHYVRRVVESLVAQVGGEMSRRRIALFQDGATSPFSGLTYAAQDDVDACVRIFKESFPDSPVFVAACNLGVALNFERAEKYVFEQLRAPAGIFFAYDLVVSPHYVNVLDHLAAQTIVDTRVGCVACYGNHLLSVAQQERQAASLSTLHHNWGFALYRRQWLKNQPYVEQYLNLLRRVDYRQRDAVAIAKLFAEWGYGMRASSQDAAKTLACCLTGAIKLNTVACFGHYIGAEGLHMDAARFEALHYSDTAMFPSCCTEFAPLQQRRYREMLAELVAWAGKPHAPAAGVEDQTIKACEHIFHEVNAALAQGRSDLGLERARAALHRLFEGVAPAGRVTLAVEPLTTLPDLTGSSQARVAFEGPHVRVSVPREILAPYFSNYFFPVVMLRRFIRDLCDAGMAEGAFTLELGDASPTERLPIAAFSATAPSARLIIDEGYFVSGGYAHVREVADRRWRDWKWRSDRVFWRGIVSGPKSRLPPPSERPVQNWAWNQRLDLCEHARRSRYADKLDIGLSSLEGVDEEYLQEEIIAAGFIKDGIAGSEILRFRHQIVIDGATSVGNGLLPALIQGACVIRIEHPAGYRSWFYDRPDRLDTHVVVKADLSDFDEKLDWVFAHPTQCAELAANARRFALSLDFDTEWQRSVATLRQLARQ